MPSFLLFSLLIPVSAISAISHIIQFVLHISVTFTVFENITFTNNNKHTRQKGRIKILPTDNYYYDTMTSFFDQKHITVLYGLNINKLPKNESPTQYYINCSVFKQDTKKNPQKPGKIDSSR